MIRQAHRSVFAVSRASGTRLLSTRASNVLGALEFPPAQGGEVPGVYDGVWGGSGDVFESVCPSTGEVLARVRSVSGRSTPLHPGIE